MYQAAGAWSACHVVSTQVASRILRQSYKKARDVAHAQNGKIWLVFKGLWSEKQATSAMALGDTSDVLPKQQST